jgi:hypothetical protein
LIIDWLLLSGITKSLNSTVISILNFINMSFCLFSLIVHTPYTFQPYAFALGLSLLHIQNTSLICLLLSSYPMFRTFPTNSRVFITALKPHSHITIPSLKIIFLPFFVLCTQHTNKCTQEDLSQN